jgi:nicotinamidase-related amidase
LACRRTAAVVPRRPDGACGGNRQEAGTFTSGRLNPQVFADSHHRLDRPRALRRLPNAAVDWQPPPEAARVWHELEPLAGDVVIRKPSYGAFYETPLDTILCGLAKDTP